PKLVNSSLNLARVLLKNNGLEVGRITLKKNPMGAGLVLEQYYKGHVIETGTPLEKGAVIDLLVSEQALASDSSDMGNDYGDGDGGLDGIK
ncbi:MAG: PASTA domain-containing protein, partial [Bacteroidia bacterium]|nr:PASTA domain-containing protein [Bacteroidia bacterium]